jgi:translocation and assembly module TamA
MSLPVGRHGAMYGAAVFLLAVTANDARAQVGPQVAVPGAPDETQLDPNAPLAPLPDLGVDWPDLDKAPAEPADPAASLELVGEARYSYAVSGIDAVASPLLQQRFDELSTLKQHADAPANAAQLDRRASEDVELLTELLRGEGYYDARVTSRIEPRGGKPLVTLEAEPGTLYRFAGVTINGLSDAGAKTDELRSAFGVKADDPVNADTIVAGQTNLTRKIGEEGFPFAKVGEPEIVVDRAARTATLDMTVVPGGEKRFGRITSPPNKVFDARHIAEIARFSPGDPYSDAQIADLRRALIQTGLVSTVDIKPVPATDPSVVDIAVGLLPAPPRTIAGELGYGTGEGARAEVSWTHRNMFPPEGALTLRGVLGTKEQLGSVVFRRNNFKARDRVLTFQAVASNLQRDAYKATSFSLSGTLERQTNIFFQKTWTWSLGAELVATDERDVLLDTGAARRRTFFIGALPTSLTYDGSDDLLNPTRGFRLGGRLSPEVSLQGKVFSAYQTVTPSLIVAGRVRLGTIVGAPRDAVAPSRRFYAGGGASVRGYGYQDIGPRDPNNDPIGGRSLTEFSLEARVKAFGNFGIVPFIDAGNIYTSPLHRFNDLRFGAGLGVRYYSNFGPIRVDVGTPLNPQPGDARIAVYVSLGQAF